MVVFCVACAPAPGLENVLPVAVELTDINPAPDIVEVRLAASASKTEYLPGKQAEVWAFRDASVAGSRGTVPGPTLRAKQGDTVIVHFTNELAEPTTIHWHGLRLPNAADGSPSSQSKVEAGASYDYVFTVRDVGSFWYHPHVRGDTQVERGLYAPFIVEGGTAIDVAADRYLVLDDVKLSADGQLSTETDNLDVMLGRQGNVLLVNGRRLPSIEVASGSRERWRFVNSANGRYFNVSLPGARMLVIGWDGGLLPEPYEVGSLLVAPGERYEVLVTFDGTPGTRLQLQNSHYDRGHDVPDPGVKPLLNVSVTASRSALPGPLPVVWRDLPVLAVTTASTPLRKFVLKETETSSGVVFSINDQVWPFNTPVMVKQGDVEIWEVRNEAEMDHPFHLHGMFFEVLEVNGVTQSRRGWKDTANVPMAKGTTAGTMRFAVRYEPQGMWMFHCHILEHAERGMMGDLMVMP